MAIEKVLKEMLQKIPEGEFYCGIGMNYNGYRIVAFPGPEVVDSGRAEHSPLHYHIFFSGKQLRINCDTLEELDGREVPKNLRKYLKENKDEIRKRVEEVFLTGACS